MKGNPSIIQSMTDPGKPLAEVTVGVGEERSEDWLQDLLFKRPELLPTSDLDNAIANLVPVARELNTGAGPIDLVFYSAETSSLVLVETKLWKNPEKHRTVVAQVIDYAQSLASSSYEDLEKGINRSRTYDNAPASLDQILASASETNCLSVPEQQEKLLKNLERGDFLILIVGDKISPNLALMTEAIHGAPGSEFQIALVELRLYGIEPPREWPILVVPRVVARTVEETRAVVRVRYEKEKPRVEVAQIDATQPTSNKRTARELFLAMTSPPHREQIERRIAKWQTEERLVVQWGTKGFSLRALRGSRELVSVVEIYPEYLGLLSRKRATDSAIPDHLYSRYLDALESSPISRNRLVAGGKFLNFVDLASEDLEAILDASEAIAVQLAQE